MADLTSSDSILKAREIKERAIITAVSLCVYELSTVALHPQISVSDKESIQSIIKQLRQLAMTNGLWRS